MVRSVALGHNVSFVRFIICRLLPGLVLLVASIVILIAAYITSPHAAAKISAILTDRLDLPVSISEIRLQGDTLIFNGVTLGNPPEFSDKHFVSLDTVRLATGWVGLLKGRRNFRLLNVNALKINIIKGSDGVWNFDRIKKSLSGGKGGTELFIDNLLLTDSDILVNGKGLRGISLKLMNVATKGSADSKADLFFDDESGNHYTVTGRFRAGAAPDAEFSLVAPSLNLAGLPGVNKHIAFSGGTGALQINTALHDGFLRTAVTATFKDAALKTAGAADKPLSGSLQSSVAYDMQRDVLSLDDVALTVDKIIQMNLKGSLHNLKSDLSYDLVMVTNNLAIARAAELLPFLSKKGSKISGTISAEKIRITGSKKHGVASINGLISLRDLLLARSGKLLLSGTETDIRIVTIRDSIQVIGELTQNKSEKSPLIESINAPYKVIIDKRMKLQGVDLPGFKSRIAGLPLTGNFAIRPEKKTPFSLSLKIPESMLTAVSSGDNLINAGSAGLSLELSGASTSQFNGSAAISLDKLSGSTKGEPFSIGSSTINTDFSTAFGHYSASGSVSFDKTSFKGVAAKGSFGFNAVDNILTLLNGKLQVKDSTLNFSRVIAVLPRKVADQPHKGFPLDAKLTGGVLSRGDLTLRGISASMRGEYAGADGAKFLSGVGEITTENLFWHGRDMGAPRADMVLSASVGKTTLAGTIFGGTLGGTVTFKPKAVASGIDFDFSLKGSDLKTMAQLINKKGAIAVAGGKLTIATRGSYSDKDGLIGKVQGEGTEIALSAASGKGLLTNGGFKFHTSLAEGNIILEEALLQIGKGAAIEMKGDFHKAFSPERYGRISYSFSRAPLEMIISPIANGLPRVLQEAALSGDIAAEGLIEVSNGRSRLQGLVHLENAGINAESGKLQVENVSGEIPFSLGFPARHNSTPEQSVVLKRESFDQQLTLFVKATDKGSLLKISKFSFGKLDFKDTALRLKAEDGIIEALSFKSSLMTGKILGQGYVAFSDKVSYGGDLLLSDLSLQQLCALFPNIKGYVSGRMDGIAMFEGRGRGIEGLNGYSYLWTRPGNEEKMLVSKEFLQKLAGKNLKGFFFRDDRPFDKGEAMASIESGYLTFDILDISNTNFFGIRDLKVTVTETQNRIQLKHLLDSIHQAVSRGKNISAKESPDGAVPSPAFKWDE